MKASQKTGLIRQVWYWPRGVGAADRRMARFHSSIPPVPQTMVCRVALPPWFDTAVYAHEREGSHHAYRTKP